MHTMTEMITKNTLFDIRSDQANRPRLQLLLMFHIPCQRPDHTYNFPYSNDLARYCILFPSVCVPIQTGALHAYSFLTPQHCLLPCLDVTMHVMPAKCMNTSKHSTKSGVYIYKYQYASKHSTKSGVYILSTNTQVRIAQNQAYIYTKYQ